MVTRLSDVVEPRVFLRYMLKETKEQTRIFTSGILRDDPSMNSFLSGGGRTVDVPFWRDLDNTEGGTANDDPASIAVPGKIDAAQDVARRQIRTRGWSSALLSAELAGDDPQRRIASRAGAYWARQFQRNLTSTLHGVYLDNVANNSGDMVVDIGTDAVGTPTDAELISAEAILDTRQTMGDAMEDLNTIIMASNIYTRLSKQNLIDFIPDSNGVVRFPTYLGYNIIVDDGAKTIAGTNRTKYVTYLVGLGAMCFAEVPVARPVETDELPAQGNGMGVDQLWTRRQFVMHPYGIRWSDTSVAGVFPTNAELENAANWTRVYPERKQIPIAFLLTNG